MGIYSSSQFFGAFCGGLVGGALLSWYDLSGVYVGIMVVTALWLAVAWSMKQPSYARSVVVQLDCREADAEAISGILVRLPGVEDAVIVKEDEAAYLKVDGERFDREKLSDYKWALGVY